MRTVHLSSLSVMAALAAVAGEIVASLPLLRVQADELCLG